MNIRINIYWLTGLLVMVSLVTTNAQVTLNLYYSDPAVSTDTAFNGNVLRAGAESGDATFFAKFSGTGTRSFEIFSPVEKITKQVNGDGYVSIRPDTSTVINASKIKSFSGTVKDSIIVTVKPLSITTINTNLTTDVVPGSEIITFYRTGAGTFPTGLISKKFKVQLVDLAGKFVVDLLNPVDQYGGREQRSISAGGIRSVKATLPASLTSGTYRVQVVTQGLLANVSGTISSTFTVKTSAPVVTTITAISVSGTYCVGSTVSFPFSTSSTFPTGNTFKVQLINNDGSVFQDLAGTATNSPIVATLPASLTTGNYRFQVAATATSVQSNTSTISIATLPTMMISGSSTVISGTTAPIRLDFTGTSPWSFTYTDNAATRLTSSSVSPTTITPMFTASTIYDKSFMKGFSDKNCAVSNVISGSAQITVISQLTITTSTVSGSLCPGFAIPVSFTASGALPADVVYQAQLSDGAGSFTSAQSIGIGSSSPVSVTLPASLTAGTGYRIQVVVQKPTTPGAVDYSGLITPVPASLLISRPDAPKVTSLSTCSGTATVPFSATGTNLKWYQTATGSTATTTTPGFSSQSATVSTYYVTQSDGSGCESVRQPVSVSVVAIPSAPSVSSFSLCQSVQGQFSTTIPNILWYTSPTSGTGSTQPPSLTSQNAGEQTAYVTQTVNGCESSRTAVKATIVPIPAAPTVVASITLCQLSGASSLTATGSGLTWYGPSGRLAGAPTPSTSTSGVQSYSVTQTVNTCESLRATTTVTVTPAPASPTVNSVSYCTSTSTASLSPASTNLRWYTQLIGGNFSTIPPVFPLATATTLTFYVSQTDGAGCESTRQPVSVTVVATPVIPAVSSLTFCQNQPGQFATSIPNLTWYPAATGGGGSSQPPAINTQNAGEQIVYVSQTVNGCESLRATVKATVYAIPPAPTVQASTSLCQNASASPLMATGTLLTWYGQSGTLTGAPTPGTSTSGVQSYSVTQTVNTCESLRATTTVTVTPAPASPTVNSVSYCTSTSTASLSPASTNLRWYTQLIGGNFSTIPPVFPLATATTLTFYVSQTDGAGCESTRQPVSASVITTPSAPSVTSVTLCQGQKSGNFTTSIPGALWYTSLTATTGTSQPPVVDNQTAGEQTFYVTQTVNGCESPKAPVKAVINATPDPPTVQSSLSLCQNTSVSSLTATGLGLTWYGSAGKLTGAPTPAISTSGVQSYSVTQSVNGCESLKASINIQVNPAPNPPGINAVQYCTGVVSTSLTASGSNLKWYETNSGSQSLTGAPTPSTNQPGVLIYYVSQTVNGCESVRQPVSVSITAASPTPTVNSVTLCQGQTTQFASIPGALWYTTATGGTGTPQPPTLNNQATGEQTVYVTQSINGCESSRATVKATVYQTPAVPTVQSSTSLCQNTTPGSLTATGTGGLNWYDKSGKLAGGPTPGTSVSGVQSFSVSQTVNGCESPRITVNVVVLPAPMPPVVVSERYCISEVSRPLSVTTIAGFIRKWYNSSSGGTGSTIEPGVFTQSPVVNTYYVTQTDGNTCESARQPISVSVVAPPSAPTVTTSQVVCQSAIVTSLTASPNTGLVWQGPGIAGFSETAPTPVTSQPGTFTYLVAQKAGSCLSPAVQILFTVNLTPTAPLVQSPTVFCVGTTSVPLSATGTKLTWYTKADRSGPSSTQVIPNISQAGATPYYVTQKDANNCESPNSVVEVRVSTKATARLTGDGYVSPGDSTAIRIHLTGDPTWTFTDWNNRQINLPNTSDSLYVRWVTPKQAQTTYAITNLSTACGVGDAGAPYVLRFSSPLAIQPVMEPLSVKAYPNPTTGDLTVDWSSPTKQTVTLQLINASGTVVRQVIRQSTVTPQSEIFQFGTQPAGTYFLQVKTGTNGTLVKSILKH